MTLQSSVAQPVRQGKYVKLAKTITKGDTYTVPASGWYVLSVITANGASSNAWFMIGSEPIFGGYSSSGNTEFHGVVPLAKNTVITARNVAATYRVNGYYPWY